MGQDSSETSPTRAGQTGPATDGRQVLYVSYQFPPLHGGGVVRAEQTCRFLREFHWRPSVLTARADGAEEVDHAFAARGIEVIRPVGGVRENRFRGRPRDGGGGAAGLATRLLRSLARWTLLPDRQVLWKRPAKRAAMRVARQHRWRCVLGSVYPITSACVAGDMADRLRLPFILEFRDVITEKSTVGPPTELHRIMLRRIERGLIVRATRIVVVSENMKQWVLGRHVVDPEHVVVLPNGFDPDDRCTAADRPEARNERFTMVYAGSFTGGRRPDVLLQGARRVIDEGSVPAEKLRIVFIGNLTPADIAKAGMEHVAETIPYVPRSEVVRWYAQTDLLLLICDKSPEQKATYPGKVFEYLATGRPILGLLDKQSALAALLARSGLGLVADAENVTEVAEKLKHAYRLWASNALTMTPDVDFIQQFNRREIVRKLASLFDEVTGDGLQ